MKKETFQFLAFLVALTALFGVVTLMRSDSAWNILAFAISMFLPFLLATIGFSTGFIGSLLLLLIVAITSFAHQIMPQNSVLTISLGLIFYKSIDLLFLRRKVQFDEVIPAITWLAALSWYQSSFFEHVIADKGNLAAQQEIILLTLAITFGLKPLEVLIAGPDRLFLKRLFICALGGLAFCALTNFILFKPILALASALYAAGLFTSLLSNDAFIDKKSVERETVGFHRQLHFVILVGILALIGSRTFSMMSFLVLAPTALLASSSGVGAAIALFWTSRVLLQTFVLNYNSNVTGINLMHPYVSASMFAGFFLSLLFTVNLMRSAKAWQDSLFFLTIAASAPIISNYFLHEEPTSGFLSSLLTASVLLVCLAPLLNPSAPEPNRLNALILLPAISLTTALLSGALLAMGNETTTADRIQLALYLTAGFATVTLIAFVTSLVRRPRPVPDVVGH
jgi:hypothetical protein